MGRSRIIAMILVAVAAMAAPAGLYAAAPTDRQAMLDRELKDDFQRLGKQMKQTAYWKKVEPTVLRREAMILPGDRDQADIVLRRTRALLEDLKTARELAEKLAPMEQELAGLEAEGRSIDPARKDERQDLYTRLCRLRRRIAFINPLLDFKSILFATHRLAVTDHMCDQYFGCFARAGGSICALDDPFAAEPKVRDLLEGRTVENGRLKGKSLAGGTFLQPALSYDGKTVLFSYCEAGRGTEKPAPRGWFKDPIWSKEMCYHVFRMNVDGSGLTQLTDGAWNDLHPVFMPDGRVLFMSERRGGFGRCHARPVPIYTLHAMDLDGGRMQRLSHHESNEWHPSINNDGMILYSRWDYVDRGHNQAHHPWVTTPDGRDARAVHGNFKKSHDDNPDMELSCLAIPHSHKFVATAAPHHNQAYGSLIVVDPRVSDDDAMGPVRRLTPDCGFPETAEKGGIVYGTAWPLGEHYYLCVYSEKGDNHGIYLIDAFGNRELLHREASIPCLGPVPVRPRPVPPIIPAHSRPSLLVEKPAWSEVGDEHAIARVAVASPTGTPAGAAAAPIAEAYDRPPAAPAGQATVGLVNVYDSLLPFPKDVRISALRIMHILPKSVAPHHHPQIGYGSETSARAVLGTVPVEEDGSAWFRLPAGKGVFFQALDDRGCAVQSMRSAAYVHPGETLVCAGCHENKARAAARPQTGTVPLAFRRPPSDIQPDVDDSNPLSFPRLVQPILDKHCAACHARNQDKPKPPPDLRPGDWQDHKFGWYLSYRNLRPFAFHYGAVRNEKVVHQYDGWQPARTIPGKFGARASRLLAHLDKGHHDVKLTPQELHRLIVWLDSNSDFYGAYEDTDAQSRGQVVRPRIE